MRSGAASAGCGTDRDAWQAPLERRFALTLILTVAGVATFWTQPSLLSLDAGVLIAGLTIAPTLIAGYALIERQTRGARQTEAMTWLSSAISVGVAVGSAICGRIIDTVGPRWGYGFAATCGVDRHLDLPPGAEEVACDCWGPKQHNGSNA